MVAEMTILIYFKYFLFEGFTVDPVFFLSSNWVGASIIVFPGEKCIPKESVGAKQPRTLANSQ
jgi:hypothetical protein